MLTGLNHITLAVSDLDHSMNFYSGLLGMKPHVRWRSGAYLTLGDCWLCLSVDEVRPSQDYSHIAFGIAASDFHKFAHYLRQARVVEWKQNKSEGDSIYLLDPDGNKLEIHCGDLRSRLESLKAKPYQDLVWLSEARDMEIKVDDLNGAEIQALLAEHLRCMYEVSPPESVHALNIDGLRQVGVTFWSIWQGDALAGCGALKELNKEHAEIKSMRTSAEFLGKGVATTLLSHLIQEARCRGYHRLSLETGSMDYFLPARKLYQKFGFKECGPFEGYAEDPNSIFMTLSLK